MKALFAALALAGLLGAPAYAACSYPKAPDKIPDGNTATLEEMLGAKKSVDAYNKEMEGYLSCIKLEHDEAMAHDAATLTEDQKKDLEKRQIQKNNAAVDELEQVAARLNEQIRIFKAKSAAKKG
jgi:hypothetical protein